MTTFLVKVDAIRRALGLAADLPAPSVIVAANCLMGIAEPEGALPQQVEVLMQALGCSVGSTSVPAPTSAPAVAASAVAAAAPVAAGSKRKDASQLPSLSGRSFPKNIIS